MPQAAAPITPIARPRQPSLPEQVRLRLSESIAVGTLAPGQLLVVDQLASALGVSKTPVREALGTLLRDGLIRQTDDGFRVAPLDSEYVREVYAVRSALESLVAEVIAPDLSNADLKELERAARSARPPDSEFHDVIRSKCSWPYVNSLIDTIQSHRARMKTLELSASTASNKTAHDEHLAIMDAFKRRDGKAARSLMQAHLDRLRDELADLAEQSQSI
jgi:DNA-binding GntR family transcriptional regulator